MLAIIFLAKKEIERASRTSADHLKFNARLVCMRYPADAALRSHVLRQAAQKSRPALPNTGQLQKKVKRLIS